jgi:hypothetical protein
MASSPVRGRETNPATVPMERVSQERHDHRVTTIARFASSGKVASQFNRGRLRWSIWCGHRGARVAAIVKHALPTLHNVWPPDNDARTRGLLDR